jgi:hypothetical protein
VKPRLTTLAFGSLRAPRRLPTRQKESTMRHLFVCALATALLGTGLCSTALAQEQEPNDRCIAFADGLPVAFPSIVQGSLDARGNRTDVDYYFLSTSAGARIRATGDSDQQIGVFDLECRLIARSGQSGAVDFTVPVSGNLTFAVASLGDTMFAGQGFSNPGPYRITLGLQPPSIGSITGRLVDAVSGEPLSGVGQPFATLSLARCVQGRCFANFTSTAVDAQGRFRVETDANALRLPPGEYEFGATGNEHVSATPTRRLIAAGEDADVGDIALRPPPFQFANVRPCSAQGSGDLVCEYSAAIRNNTSGTLRGLAHSVVQVARRSADFEASTEPGGDGGDVHRARVEIPPFERRSVTFAFDVPAALPQGIVLCTRLQLGLEPAPLVSSVRDEPLFCVRKSATGLHPLARGETAELVSNLP